MPLIIEKSWTNILQLASVSEEHFEETGLSKQELSKIFSDFKNLNKELKPLAEYIVNQVLTFSRVHSVRYRIKDPEHLIAKIIRKKIEKPEKTINAENYLSKITDLIGIRILHLFKDDIFVIDRQIRDIFKLTSIENPILYHRKGDDLDSAKLKGFTRNLSHIIGEV